jgi:NAD(P)-dependent dehydrogenase (short-subunit alcohol dehydrogenase family)
VLPLMEAPGGGAIVTVASKASVGAGAAGIAYTTSKHAVVGLVKSIAYYYAAKGIRSNAVLPGAVATAIGARRHPGSGGRWTGPCSRWPPCRRRRPTRIRECHLLLASDEAANINGATLLDDGGWATA